MADRYLSTRTRGFPGPTLAIVPILIAAGVFLRAAEEPWSKCSMPSAQFVLQIPSSLIHSTASTATGCSFQTSDGEFNVEAVASPEATADAANLEQRMQKEIQLLGGTMAHQKKGDNWFSLSGVTTDGTEYYRKLITNGSQWVTLRITYPHAQSKKYDHWVKRIDKTFIAFAENAEKNETKASPTARANN